MPVPVSTTNPGGKGTDAAKNTSLPSKGSLFSKLGAASADAAMQDKKIAMAQDKPARRPDANGATDLANAPQHDGPSVVCKSLKFHYTGDDGLPMPGAASLACVTCVACIKLAPDRLCSQHLLQK